MNIKRKNEKENQNVQKQNEVTMYGLTLKIEFVFVTHPKIESYVYVMLSVYLFFLLSLFHSISRHMSNTISCIYAYIHITP